MRFQCKARPNAVPIVAVATHNERGELLPKPINRTKVVKHGGYVGWVDLCSRKHFIAVDDEAKALNVKDYKKMLVELKRLRVKDKDIPADATFDYLADSLAAIKAKTNVRLQQVVKPLLQPSEDVESVAVVDPEVAAVRVKIEAFDKKWHNKAGIKKLNEQFDGLLKAWLDENDVEYADDATITDLEELKGAAEE